MIVYKKYGEVEMWSKPEQAAEKIRQDNNKLPDTIFTAQTEVIASI